MTDQTRYPAQRGNSPQARSGSEGRFSRRPEDPLAELARLIGQDDPFADFNTRSRATPAVRGAQSQSQPKRQSNGNGADNAYPRAARRDDVRDNVYDDDRYEQAVDDFDRAPEPSYARQYDDEAGYALPQPSRLPAARASNGRAYAYGGAPVARAEPPMPRTRPVARPQPAPEPEFEDDYAEPQYDYRNGHGNGHDASYRQARAPEDSAQYRDGPYEQEYAPEYESEYAPEEYTEEYAEPPRNRRWMLIGIMSLIGLVVLGVAGLYGYRAVFKRQASSNPPTIRSAMTPTGTVPNAAQANADGSKQNYDRIGEQPLAGGERVVSREEQPAAFNADPGGRTVTTTPIGPGGSASASAFAAPAQTAPALIPPSGSSNTASGEPKRVRTMSVRSDGSVVNNNPRPAQAAPARSVTAPLALNPNAQPETQDGDDQPAVTQPAARPGPRSAAPSSNQQAWANVEPARTQASNSNYVPAGSYVVQVSSQKSETDAQTAWRQLQAKYTNVLGDAQVSFKRVDLGDRGTFYRAMVGPFGNRDQAYEMCQNLKAAGGECVVQRN